MIFDANMFDLRVPDVVFCEATHSFVVAMKKRGCGLWHADAFEELAKEDGFVRGIM
jgi:hypothetical protein